MNSPRLLCAACNNPTSVYKPVCDDCLTFFGEVPIAFCALCHSGLPVKNGLHQTKTGGYAGRCEANNAPGDPS